MKNSVFWDANPVASPVSCLAYSSTLKMHAIYSSETSVCIQRATLRYVPECRFQVLNDIYLWEGARKLYFRFR
jgi:hypothetical protein